MTYGRVDRDSVFDMAGDSGISINEFYRVLFALADNGWLVVKAQDANNQDA